MSHLQEVGDGLREEMNCRPLYLETQCGVVLLEEVVPDVQRAIHLGGEEDGRPDWTPAAVRHVGHVVPGKQPKKSKRSARHVMRAI